LRLAGATDEFPNLSWYGWAALDAGYRSRGWDE
jgi:hypothetical protein